MNYSDPSGYRPVCQLLEEEYGPNTEFLMAFYGVNSPERIPELPEGTMIFVENCRVLSIEPVSVIKGKTIIMDANKYCEYTFTGAGVGQSGAAIPLDYVMTQGYVYGTKSVTDFCGFSLGLSANMLGTAEGGSLSFSDVSTEIIGGMNYIAAVGVSGLWYETEQTDWIYGKANMRIIPNIQQYGMQRNPQAQM